MPGADTCLAMQRFQGPPVTVLMGYLLVPFLLLMPAGMQKSWRATRVPPCLCRENLQGYL